MYNSMDVYNSTVVQMYAPFTWLPGETLAPLIELARVLNSSCQMNGCYASYYYSLSFFFIILKSFSREYKVKKQMFFISFNQ